MKLEKLQAKATVKDLYKKYSQEQIMEYYFGEYIRLKRHYTNPFRKDRNPSCTFYYTPEGKLLFRDFATGEAFDCIDIANLRVGYKISASEIIKHLEELPAEKTPKPKVKFNPTLNNLSETVIKVEIIPFEEKDYAFWEQFNINVDVLKKFNVRKVNKVWTNGALTYLAIPSDPCYRYMEDKRIKLYRPFNKRYKFRNNYNVTLEGTKFIPERGDLLVITKAMKDVMALSTLGIYAVCPTSESRLIEPEVMMPLFDRFKTILVWYDADPTGRERSDIMYEKYKEFGLVKAEHNLELGKDISDIIKAHGIEKLKDLCKQLEIL